MSLAVECDRLLREIRDLRESRQRQLDLDLAEIDRAYEQQVDDLRRKARRARLLNACVWSLTVAAIVVTLIAS